MPTAFSNLEREAIYIYAVGARDWSDFIDLVLECKELEVLQLLHEMLVQPDSRYQELNRLLAPIVSNEITKRGAVPRKPEVEA